MSGKGKGKAPAQPTNVSTDEAASIIIRNIDSELRQSKRQLTGVSIAGSNATGYQLRYTSRDPVSKRQVTDTLSFGPEDLEVAEIIVQRADLLTQSTSAPDRPGYARADKLFNTPAGFAISPIAASDQGGNKPPPQAADPETVEYIMRNPATGSNAPITGTIQPLYGVTGNITRGTAGQNTLLGARQGAVAPPPPPKPDVFFYGSRGILGNQRDPADSTFTSHYGTGAGPSEATRTNYPKVYTRTSLDEYASSLGKLAFGTASSTRYGDYLVGEDYEFTYAPLYHPGNAGSSRASQAGSEEDQGAYVARPPRGVGYRPQAPQHGYYPPNYRPPGPFPPNPPGGSFYGPYGLKPRADPNPEFERAPGFKLVKDPEELARAEKQRNLKLFLARNVRAEVAGRTFFAPDNPNKPIPTPLYTNPPSAKYVKALDVTAFTPVSRPVNARSTRLY
jgi:hypothetical protein